MSIPKVEVLSIEQGATPDPANINKHTQRGRGLHSNSMKKRGAGRSIFSAGKGVDVPVVIGGNQTLEIAAEMGLEIINVHTTGKQIVNVVRDDIAPGSVEAIALGLEDNEIGRISYAPDLDLLAQMAAGDHALLTTLRKQDDIFNSIVEGMGVKEERTDTEPQIDRAAELLEKWQVKTGQLWALGEHKLICGDCTDAAVVGRVMGGKRAVLCFTSPPYSNLRDYELGDFDFKSLYKGFIKNTDYCDDILVNFGMKFEEGEVVRYWDEWLVYCKSIGLPLFGWYVWDKLNGMPGDFHGRLANSHEFVFHFRRNKKQANKWIETKEEFSTSYNFRQKDGSFKKSNGGIETIRQDYKIPDSVIRLSSEKTSGTVAQLHPAVFPVTLPEFIIKTWSKEKEIMYEPFSGSGTSIIACENLHRKCRAIEISPAYCAVALERYLDHTGVMPVLLSSKKAV